MKKTKNHLTSGASPPVRCPSSNIKSHFTSRCEEKNKSTSGSLQFLFYSFPKIKTINKIKSIFKNFSRKLFLWKKEFARSKYLTLLKSLFFWKVSPRTASPWQERGALFNDEFLRENSRFFGVSDFLTILFQLPKWSKKRKIWSSQKELNTKI